MITLTNIQKVLILITTILKQNIFWKVDETTCGKIVQLLNLSKELTKKV